MDGWGHIKKHTLNILKVTATIGNNRSLGIGILMFEGEVANSCWKNFRE